MVQLINKETKEVLRQTDINLSDKNGINDWLESIRRDLTLHGGEVLSVATLPFSPTKYVLKELQ